MMLGDILVELGVLTREQLARVTRQQLLTGGALGQVACELGFCVAADVAAAIAVQARRRSDPAAMALSLLEAKVGEMSADARELAQMIRGTKIKLART